VTIDREIELLELIYSAPDDDAHRLVYADWLLERGDPRGEFIVLQYKKEREALDSRQAHRERQLLRDRGEAWLGPLAPVIDARTMVFRKGFLAECQASFASPAQKVALLGNPLWATVEKLDADADVLAHPCMRSLRAIGPLPAATVLALQDQRLLAHIREVQLEVPESSQFHPAWEQLPAVITSRLPGVRTFTFSWPDVFLEHSRGFQPTQYKPWLQGTGALGLECVIIRERMMLAYPRWESFDSPHPDLARWLEFCRSSAHLRQLVLQPYHGWIFALQREDAGWSLDIDWNTVAATADIKGLELALSRVNRGAFAHIAARISGVERPHHRRMLEQVLGRFPEAAPAAT
jgi:uncharacterized protein (TIGR02996 family)